MFFNKTCTLGIENTGHGILKDGRKIPMIVTKPLLNKKLAKKLFEEKSFSGLQFFYLKKLKAVQLAFQSGKQKMSFAFEVPKDIEVLCSTMKEKYLVLVHQENMEQLVLQLDGGVDPFLKQFREEVMGDHLRSRLRKENKEVEDFDAFITLMIDHYAKGWKESQK